MALKRNPWNVTNIKEFSFLNCPECNFKTKQEDFFQDHAIQNHPMSHVLFNLYIESTNEVQGREI